MLVENLIPLKIYALFSKPISDKIRLKEMLNICITYMESQSNFKKDRQAFYYFAAAELSRQLGSNKEMIHYRDLAKIYCTQSTFINYLIVCEVFADNQSSLIKQSNSLGQYETERFKSRSFKQNNFNTLSGHSIEDLFNQFKLKISDMDSYRNFIMNATLLDIIKKHFPEEIVDRIKKL